MKTNRWGWVLALAPAASLGACGTETMDREPLAERWSALVTAGVEANVALQSSWQGGYCADVTVRNDTAATIRNWKVTMNFRQSTVSSAWNATQSGNVFAPVAFNSTVAPGQTAAFGFCANATGTDFLPQVSALTFDGTSTGGTGGASSTGGATSTGGTTATGGTTSSTGGTTASGGTTTTGGTSSTGGSTTTGGATSSTDGGTSSSASLHIDSDWGAGYCATVTAAANSVVRLQMNSSELNNLWNGVTSTSGSLVTVTVAASATSFGFCARALATTNYRAVIVGSTNGSGGSGGGNSTGGATSTGGTSASGGTTSTGGASSTGGSSGGGGYPPIQTGCSGYATRFWDCCKPHCSWSGNVPSGVTPLRSCNAQNQPIASYDEQSACSGGSAHTCYGLTPIRISDTLSYGYAATSSGDVCGKCYQLQFTGSSHNAGSDAGSAALSGKTMIVQAINVGYDVGGGQFDLLVPGGGVGAFNACSAEWGVSNSELGAQYGGLLTACKSQVGGGNLAALKSCLNSKCDSVFGSRGLSELQAGCRWYADWFEAADNPALKYKEVACPAELSSESGMSRPGSVQNSCGN